MSAALQATDWGLMTVPTSWEELTPPDQPERDRLFGWRLRVAYIAIAAVTFVASGLLIGWAQTGAAVLTTVAAIALTLLVAEEAVHKAEKRLEKAEKRLEEQQRDKVLRWIDVRLLRTCASVVTSLAPPTGTDSSLLLPSDWPGDRRQVTPDLVDAMREGLRQRLRKAERVLCDRVVPPHQITAELRHEAGFPAAEDESWREAARSTAVELEDSRNQLLVPMIQADLDHSTWTNVVELLGHDRYWREVATAGWHGPCGFLQQALRTLAATGALLDILERRDPFPRYGWRADSTLAGVDEAARVKSAARSSDRVADDR